MYVAKMSRKRQLDEMVDMSRYRMVSLALTIAMEDDDDDDIVIAGIKRPRPRVHGLWMSPFLKDRTDSTQRNTLAKLEADFIRLGCVSDFKKTTRMQPHIYKELLEMVRPLITYKDTNYRSAISAEERLSITIRYLTRGDSTTTLHQGYLVGESTILPLVRDTCRALYSVLHDKYLQAPSTRDEWLMVSKQFHDRWNLPHVLGSLDGKHVRIKKPNKSGSLFYNYKNYYSIVLFALVDADYKFLYVDVGAEGRSSDSTLWKFSAFHKDLNTKENPLGVPEASTFPGYPGPLEYYFVADDAFEMGLNLMKPYPTTKLTMQQRIFNYRLSRTRRIVENAFGILATRFRILRREIEMTPENASIVVLACVVLHNFLRVEAGSAYIPRQATDWEDKNYHQHKGIWRCERALAGGEPTKTRNRSDKVKDMRNNLARWCMTKEGELKYQYDVVLEHDFYFER